MKLLEHFHELSLHPKNAKELKGLILQLAVQGKLTAEWRKNNPNIEPAEKLLERIKAEKAKLIKEGKIRKEKPLPPITLDEMPFELPESWVWCRMQDYLDVRDGTHDTPKYVDNGIPLVTSKNLYTKKLDLTNIKYISEQDHQEISHRSKVDKFDILFAMIGSIGNPVIVDIEPNFSIKNVALIKYYVQSLYEPNYILNFLEFATQDFKDNSDGAVQSFVSLKKLREKELPLPPLEEQKAIVKTVEQLFKEVEQLETLTEERIQLKEKFAISALDKLNNGDYKKEWEFLKENFHPFFNEEKNIKKLRETVLQLAVQGKLTEKWRKENPNVESAEKLLERIKAEKTLRQAQGSIKKEKPLPPITEDDLPAGKAGIPYHLPDGWVWCRLGNYIYNLGQKKPDTKFTYIDVGSINKEKGFITENNTVLTPDEAPSRARKIIKKGCVLYSTVRPYLLNIAIVNRNYKYEPIASTAFAILNPLANCSSEYLYFYLRSQTFIMYVEEQMIGVAYPAINDRNLLKGIIPIPPLEEQKAIVEKVNTLMALCDSLEQQVKLSKEQIEKLMKSVLREVFDGEEKDIKELLQTENVMGMAAEAEAKYEKKMN
ncbi:MAG: restriction endonuclease subunit S [Bacteroidetes bacterium]|nr:restriction endonuclease subunit S [Bacteroidota bacterium]